MSEWDESKNQRNLEKHGIAFEDVLSVFANREALALEDKRRDYGEPVRRSLPSPGRARPCDVHGARREHQADLGPARQQAREVRL